MTDTIPTFLPLFQQCDMISIDDSMYSRSTVSIDKYHNFYVLAQDLHFSADAIQAAQRVDEGYWAIKEKRGGWYYWRLFVLGEIT
jgi:hypothetical protein